MIKTLSLLALAFLVLAGAPAQEKVMGPVRVKIQDEKPVLFEPVLPIDPVRRVEYQAQPNLGLRVTVEQRTLHLGFIFGMFNIDGQMHFPNQIAAPNSPLPKTPGGKVRDGIISTCIVGKIRVTQTVEVIATKLPKAKERRRDAVLVRYSIENTDNVPHKVGLRLMLDTFIVDNDGALFAAPNQPGKVLDGVELKDKMVPDYLEILQRPDLNNPGFVARQTFALGNGIEKPTRLVLSGLRANFGNNWDMQAIPAMGDSAMCIYWDPKEIKPQAKREIGYAFGQGVAEIGNEGLVKVDLSGSFEPGKLFTVNAFVSDPTPGQNLTLDLPPGMERVEGKEVQPVPAIDAEGNTLVQWKARVLRPGQFTLRVQSSNGATLTKLISITPVDPR